MNRKKLQLVLILILMLTLATGCSNSQTQDEIQEPKSLEPNKSVKYDYLIAGSGSNLGLTQVLLDEYESKYNVQIELPPSIGSGGAVKAVETGAIYLGLSSRPLKDKEKQLGLKEVPYAKIGIIFGVNSSVPDDNITIEEITQIYRGDKTTWSNDEMIIVLMREEDDSSNKVLAKQIPGMDEIIRRVCADKRWEVFYTDQDTANAIVNTANAIGLTDTATITTTHPVIKPLKVDGIVPSLENIESGKYIFTKDLYFIYKENDLPQWGRDFLSYVFSREGQAVISKNGAIPLVGEY